MRIERRSLSLTAAVIFSVSLAACASSIDEFHHQVLVPLAAQKADELAEHNRLQVSKAFEEAKRYDRLPGERWFDLFYWGLDALGFAGYGMPGQGRILEKLKEFYTRTSTRRRELELQAVLRRIEEEKVTNRKSILNDLINHTSEEFSLFGRIYSVCQDGIALRYRKSSHGFRNLYDQPC
jgi:hypothetical protein